MTASVVLPLSTALREETTKTHNDAENSLFMSALARGELDTVDVIELTTQYWYIYQALEAAVRRLRSADPAVNTVTDRRLERVPALEADLAHMLGPQWRTLISPTAATLRYTSVLDNCSKDDTPTVIAHHYVRYLGDIAGGQVIARILRTAYGLSDDDLHFYDFSAIGKIPPFRTLYRSSLDSLVLTSQQRTQLIDAEQEAFRLNQAVFADLQARRDRRKKKLAHRE